MKRNTGYLLVAICVATACSAFGAEFRTFGPRALSMGGAGVARPDGAYASYYNPAALGLRQPGTDVGLAVGLTARDTGIAEHLQNILDQDVKWDEATANPEGPAAAVIIGEILQINTSDGIFVVPNGALGVRTGPLGVGAYPSGEIAIYTDLDKQHINPTDPLEDPNSFFYNSSTLYAQGLGLVEVPIAYGVQFEAGSGTLCVGGALKFIQGATYDVAQRLTVDMDTVQDTLENSDKMASSFGIDAGALYESGGGNFSAGLLVRNLNSPEFETVRDEKFTEDMQARAGVAYSLTRKLEVAVDVDVTANETLVGGYKSRKAGGGICLQATEGISLRGGLSTNMEADDAPLVFSAGLSLGFKSFNLDLAAAIPSEWTEIDGNNIPSEGSASLMLRSAW